MPAQADGDFRLDPHRASLATQLGRLLRSTGYTVEGLEALWGAAASAALQRENPIPALRALGTAEAVRELSAPERAALTLARLFLLALPQAVAAVEQALPVLGVRALLELGLVAVEVGEPAARADASAPSGAAPEAGAADMVRAVRELRPYSLVDERGSAQWWIVSDLGERAVGGTLPEDHVLGVGGASRTLAELLLQQPVERALDLGCGCGILALHASRWADAVIATDLSQRAVETTALNAAINGAQNIAVRQGDLFQPVAGERFERIVSNPPFVITPRSGEVPRYDYRDGGLEGDALVESVVRGAAAHLSPGGIAQLLGNWEYRSGADAGAGVDSGAGSGAGADSDGLRRAASWAAEAGLEHWIIEREQLDAAGYAETWIRDGGTRPGTPGYEPMMREWLDDFERRGVASVGFGYVLLRSAEPGPPALSGGEPGASARHPQEAPRVRLERIERLSAERVSSGSQEYARALTAFDRLVGADDAALLHARLRYPGDVTEERHFMPGDDDPVVILLRQGGGFGRSRRLGSAQAAFVGACDGELAVGAIIEALAELLEQDVALLRPELLGFARGLLFEGFLDWPASDAG